MVRAFATTPIDPAVIDGLLDLARRAPSAGNSQGAAFVVLEGADQTARYWAITRPSASFRWQALLDAPVLVLALTRPGAYLDRYSEPDKAATGLGQHAGAWPVPYWWVDAGAAVEHVLLGAVDAGLGALFFGVFQGEAELLADLGVPDGWRLVGTIALGHPLPDEPGLSAGRPRKPLDDLIHRGGW